jgi:nucleoredoxin
MTVILPILQPETVLVKSDGSCVKFSEITAPLIGLYFSAEWCPPCKIFTPILGEFYDEVKENDKQVSVCSILVFRR